MRARDTATLSAQFAEIAAHPARHVVISAEPLCELDEDSVRYLAGFCGAATVTVGFVWRPLPDLIRAYWQEWVRHGSGEDFAAFLAGRLLDPGRDRLLNPSATLEPFAAAFGREAIRILSYPDCLEAGGNLLDGLLAAGGLSAINPAPRVVHPSPPLAVSEVARALTLIAHTHVPRPPGLPDCLVDAVAGAAETAVCAHAIALAGTETRTFTLDQGVAPFGSLHAQFSATWRDRMDATRAFDAEAGRVARLTVPDPAWLLHPDAVPTLHQLFAALCGLPRAPDPAAKLAREVTELRAALTAMRRSASWRLTAPLRRVAALRLGGDD